MKENDGEWNHGILYGLSSEEELDETIEKERGTMQILGIGSRVTVPDVVHSDQEGMYWEGVVTGITKTSVLVTNEKSGEVVELEHKVFEG